MGEIEKKPTEWHEGFDAFNGGFDATKGYKLKLITENPYSKETEQYEAWKEGYKHARHTKYASHTPQPSTNRHFLNVVLSAMALCFFLVLANHFVGYGRKSHSRIVVNNALERSGFAMPAKSRSKSRSETAVNNAYKVCSAFDSTGVLSEPCEVSGWGSTIDIYIDTNSREAREFCLATASKVRNHARLDGWKIKIYSPFSGGNTIAQCSL